MKRLSLLSIALFSLALAACGGGSSGTTPPPPAGGFTNASLHGQYAFSMSGLQGGCDIGLPNCGAFIARTGSFIADGNGNITGGLEDVIAETSGDSLVQFTSGTYTIQANGRGLVVLQDGSGGGLQLNIMLTSTSQGAMVQTDLNATSSGNFILQSTADFNSGALNGKYVFDFNGLSFGNNVLPISTIGEFVLDGNGNVTGGLLDDNDGNASGPSGALAITPGTYALDTSGSGVPFGRGTLSFAGRAFAFYVVSRNRLKIIEEDQGFATLGDANIQSSSIATSNAGFTGSFVYLVGGASIFSNNSAADIRVARFTADGNGGIAGISFDENNSGSALHFAQGSNISAATYAIDTTNAGSGRGTFTFTDSHGGKYTYVFYLISPTQAVLQDTSKAIIADGPMQAQAGAPFTNANITGNYGFNWSGVQLGSQNAIPFEEDFVGQYALTNTTSNNASGVMDYTELGLSGKQLYPNTFITGTLNLNGDGTNNNTFQILNHNSPSTTYNFVAYVVNPSTTYMIVTDSTRVTAGIATQQSQ